MSDDPIVVVSIARTPMGSFQGELAALSATELGSVAVGKAVEASGVKEISKAMQSVNEAGSGTADGARSLERSARDLSALAGELKHLVVRYTV